MQSATTSTIKAFPNRSDDKEHSSKNWQGGRAWEAIEIQSDQIYQNNSKKRKKENGGGEQDSDIRALGTSL